MFVFVYFFLGGDGRKGEYGRFLFNVFWGFGWFWSLSLGEIRPDFGNRGLSGVEFLMLPKLRKLQLFKPTNNMQLKAAQ